MLVLPKRNIVIMAPDGSASVRLARGVLCDLPDWAAQTPYFSGLVKDGKIVVTGKNDKALQTAEEKKTKTRRGAKTTEE